MGFSATGSLLTGSVQRPDITTFIMSQQFISQVVTNVYSTNCKLNKCGYIPGLSTITGLGRALLGIVHTIVHLACTIFSKNRRHHLQEASLGSKNIARGIIEAVPVIGNIIMNIVDKNRIIIFENMTRLATSVNYVAIFGNGQEIKKQSMSEFAITTANFQNKFLRTPHLNEYEKLVRNKYYHP